MKWPCLILIASLFCLIGCNEQDQGTIENSKEFEIATGIVIFDNQTGSLVPADLTQIDTLYICAFVKFRRLYSVPGLRDNEIMHDGEVRLLEDAECELFKEFESGTIYRNGNYEFVAAEPEQGRVGITYWVSPWFVGEDFDKADYEISEYEFFLAIRRKGDQLGWDITDHGLCQGVVKHWPDITSPFVKDDSGALVASPLYQQWNIDFSNDLEFFGPMDLRDPFYGNNPNCL